MTKAILFDLGGVVIDFTNYEQYVRLARISKMHEREVKKIVEARELDLLERDMTDIRSFERFIAHKINVPVNKIQWYESFRRVVKINPDVQELVEMLHKEYATAFISNIDKTRYTYTRKILNLNAFDYRFTSCFIGYRKPEPKVYKFALKKMKIKPEDAIFIDNMLENVEAARKIGIRSVHFINRRMLDKELARFGV